jgi:hypothetical protein
MLRQRASRHRNLKINKKHEGERKEWELQRLFQVFFPQFVRRDFMTPIKSFHGTDSLLERQYSLN